MFIIKNSYYDNYDKNICILMIRFFYALVKSGRQFVFKILYIHDIVYS